MAKAKKVDPKMVAKEMVMDKVSDVLVAQGMTVLDGENYGFTKGTIIVRLENVDIQLKPIAPKAGVDRYEEVTE
jgi:hypothetical protein